MARAVFEQVSKVAQIGFLIDRYGNNKNDRVKRAANVFSERRVVA